MQVKITLILMTLFLVSAGELFAKNRVLYGNSSWYGGKFHGRKTASGEVYDMYKMTAAHRTLPLGTYLKVTNVENGRSVIVKVNDRGPFKPNRHLDVSKGAAQKLGFIKKGLTRVKMEILGKYYDTASRRGSTEENYHNERSDGSFQLSERDFRNGKASENYRDRSSTKRKVKYRQPKRQETVSYSRRTYSRPAPRTRPDSGADSGDATSKTVILVKTKIATKKSSRMVYKIQLGAFTNLELALKRKKRYEAMGLKSVIVLFKGEGKIFRLISKKSYSTEDSARLASSRMKDKGLSAFIFRF